MGGTGIVDPELEISVDQFRREWQRPGVRLIDVREPDEWEAGRMAGAELIPLSEFEARVGELDPAAPTVVVCRSGRRSLAVAEYLRDLGFARPVSLAGGLIAWAEAGQPIEP